MKNFKSASVIFALLVALGTQAIASVTMPGPSVVRDILNQGVPNGFASRLGDYVIDKKVQLLKAKYRFDEIGGASVVTNINGPTTIKAALKDSDGNDAQLPINAVVKQVTIDVLNSVLAYPGPEPYSTVQLAVGVNAADDLMPWQQGLGGIVAGRKVGTMNGSSVASYVKTVATSTVYVHQRRGSVIQGDFNVFIEYLLSD